MRTQLIKLIILALSGLSLSSQAEEEITNSDSGLKVGGGFFGAPRKGTDSNSICLGGYTGYSYGIGYDFNNIAGIDFKYAYAEDANNCNVTMSYIGLNLGHNFNTEWLNIYGKIGYTLVKEDVINMSSFSDSDNHHYSYSDYGAAFGIGSSINFSGDLSGIYLTLESIVDKIQNNNIGGTVIVEVGYRF
mgnify:CR=1 FL=1